MLERLVVVFFCAALVFTSLLFFIRTRAVFNMNPWVVAFFAGLWLALLGVCLSFIVDIFKPVLVNPASNTTICYNISINRFVAATTIIPLINDTLVFLAISWRLSRNSYDPYTLKSGIRFIIFGEYLPKFSKALLQDGQAYYLLAPFLIYVSC
jgi:chromate transport protein ChrA